MDILIVLEIKKHKNSTTLASLVWEKGLNPKPKTKWTVLKKTDKYSPGNKRCELCLTEKFYIIKNLGNQNLLNKKTEFISKCRHQNKYIIGNFREGIG